MEACKGNSLPATAGTVLRDSDGDEGAVRCSPDEVSLNQQIIGSLIYHSNLTRPDIAYMVGQLARHMSKPLNIHLETTKPLLRYLRRTLGDGITYGKGGDLGEYGGKLSDDIFDIWSDATWGTELDRKSFQGWMARYYGGLISWAANRQRSTDLFSLDSEKMF